MSDERKAIKLAGAPGERANSGTCGAHGRLRASPKRLQDPDYVVKIIQECQRRG
jgi:hypothetical protein